MRNGQVRNEEKSLPSGSASSPGCVQVLTQCACPCCSSTSKDKLPSLLVQMLRYFGLTVTISIVLIGIVLAVSVSVTSDRTLAITRNGLNDQTDR